MTFSKLYVFMEFCGADEVNWPVKLTANRNIQIVVKEESTWVGLREERDATTFDQCEKETRSAKSILVPVLSLKWRPEPIESNNLKGSESTNFGSSNRH